MRSSIKKDLEELKKLGILNYKTVNEMLNAFHEKLLETIEKICTIHNPFKKREKTERKAMDN